MPPFTLNTAIVSFAFSGVLAPHLRYPAAARPTPPLPAPKTK